MFDPYSFRGKKVLITGGLGFIGSNLAHRLVELGAKVLILDALIPVHGGSWQNIDGIQGEVKVVVDDIRNRDAVNRVVARQDYIFNLAGQVSYTDSMEDPLWDLDISCRGHLNILEACRRYNQNAKIMFASSRLVYASNADLPISETSPTEPRTIYGVHKLTVEKYHLLYHHVYGMRTCALRIANPYGPRQTTKGGKYGIVTWFINLAMNGETIRVFGEGNQLRDYIFVDDLVDAFLRVALSDAADGYVFNAGFGEGTHFCDMALLVTEIVGNGQVEFVKWPEGYARIESGDFVADISRLCRITGYKPTTSLREGIRKTFRYLQHLQGHEEVTSCD